MNNNNSGSSGTSRYKPPSRATPSTLCQKCLQRGHFSYECTTPLQQRPYVPRPSRTQQLRNPKLRPELVGDTPNELLQTEGIADAQLAKNEREREQAKRRDSVSSVDSVSTISTNASRSPPPGKMPSPSRSPRRAHRQRSPDRHKRRHSRGHSTRMDDTGHEKEHRRHRRRDRSKDRQLEISGRHDRSRSRSPRQRRRSRDEQWGEKRPNRRLYDEESHYTRHSRGRSPIRGRPPTREKSPSQHSPPNVPQRPEPERPRSLSPYSKRVALTKALRGER